MNSLKHIRIFLASPGDLGPERDAVRAVVNELNSTLSSILKLWVEVLSWETHAFPAIGPDAQSTINSQLGTDYDIFLGMAWARIGTRTPRAESGTVEEFEIALERWRKSPDKAHIMFYFKDGPLPPSQIDHEQIHKVQEFKRRLQALGVLYWTVQDVGEFIQQLRIHLTRLLSALATTPVASPNVISKAHLLRQLSFDVEECLLKDDKVKQTLDGWATTMLSLSETILAFNALGLLEAWTFSTMRSRFTEWCETVKRSSALIEQKRMECISADQSCRAQMHKCLEQAYADDVAAQAMMAFSPIFSSVEESLLLPNGDEIVENFTLFTKIIVEKHKSTAAAKLFESPLWLEAKQCILREVDAFSAFMEAFLLRRRGLLVRYKPEQRDV